MKISKNLEPYVVLTDDDITFKGDTAEEQELNKWLFHTTLELNKYQDMTQELLKYIDNHNCAETAEIYNIIKKWEC